MQEEPTTSYSKNRAFLNDQGIVEVHLIGDQTESTLWDIHATVLPILEKLRAEGQPIDGLIDMSQQTSYSLASDKAALEILDSIQYDHLALCSAPHATVVRGIILAIGRDDATKFFDQREEAVAWLYSCRQTKDT